MTEASRFLSIGVLLLALSLGNITPPTARAATPGLPFTEDFSDTSLRDASLTNANWSTDEQALVLAWRWAQYGVFGPDLTGSDVSADANATRSMALGDVDGDGDLDLVAGNDTQANRLYLNNGTANPFNGVSGSSVSADTHLTHSVALEDVDRDGDLDLVVGNGGQTNRLYLNNGTANPFSGVSGSNISADAHSTRSIVLGDVDGDGDLDVVVGNNGNNRLYLNNGTASPFSGVSGSNVCADTDFTRSVALGDMDGDGDLDVVAGNQGQVNRVCPNNGTANPFGGVNSNDVSADVYDTTSVVLGDVDRDGELDVVVGNYGSNRLYRRALYHTGQGRAGSLRVATETGNIDRASLTPMADLPINTSVTYWLSNNGGARWFIVQPGAMFVFPTAGIDLRWRAELHSLSPVRTPRIDQIVITSNQAPIANAGSDQNVNANALVTLDGSGSSDPDGNLPLTYYWTQTGGPAVTLSNPAIVAPSFTAPSDPAVLTFILAVTDSLDLPDPTPDEVVVTIQSSRIYLPLVVRRGE
jgi:hypothetical protein